MQLEENGNVVHEVCRAKITYFDYNKYVSYLMQCKF